jgi:hypothetical protein
MVGIFAAALLLHAGVALVIPARQPAIHDEFSYLLAADTFLNGRMANPSHPLWEHFEIVHVLSQPTYSSMYPPAQGLILALGKLISGHYMAGVWLTSALLCALVYWMLLGWLPARWAFLGALFTIFRVDLFSYWANSYWGGAHAAISGVLIFGSIPRLASRPQKLHAIWIALGLILLVNSRPYETVFIALSTLILLIWELGLKGRVSFKQCLRATLPTALIVILPGVLLILYYQKQVTGHWMRMGLQENYQRYGLAVLPWQSTQMMRTPVVKHMEAFYEYQREIFRNFRNLRGSFANRLKAFGRFWSFFVGPLFTLPLLCFLINWRKRHHLQLLVPVVVFLVGLAVNPWFFPHYFAPVFGLYFLMLVQGLREMRAWRVRGIRPLRVFVSSMPLIAAAVSVATVCVAMTGLQKPENEYVPSWHNTAAGNVDRAKVQAYLMAQPGKHLVLVAYGQNHNPLVDWVYNEANIDAAKVVWSHDLGREKNAELFQYYPERQVWRIHIDSHPLRLEGPKPLNNIEATKIALFGPP